jgi:translation elongation factor EF-1alpha
MCSIDYPIPTISLVKAQIMTLDINAPLNVGQTLIVHSQSQKTNAKLKKIYKIFSLNGQTTKNNTRYYTLL